MNLMDELNKVINNNNLDDFTIVRYIYLYVCNMFSYDTRFIFASPSLKNEIYYKDINIKSVEEYEIVCYSYAKILIELLSYYGYNCNLIREENDNGRPHVYVVVKLNDRLIKLDPTIKHDTSRVKMNIGTYDFMPLTDDPTFEEDLIQADEQLKTNGMINSNMINGDNYYKEINYLASLNKPNDKEGKLDFTFFDKLNAIFKLVNMKTEFKRYDDIDYYFSYLLKKSRLNEKQTLVKPAIFFNNDDTTMKDIINIILVEFYKELPIFYIMEKIGDNYKIRESTGEEVLDKLNQYSNWRVEEYFRTAAELSAKKKFI